MNFLKIFGRTGAILFLAISSLQAEIQLSGPIHLTDIVLSPQAVELVYLGRDSTLDAVVVGMTDALYGCYPGVGDGSFRKTGAVVGTLYLQPTDLVVADFDGDGYPDIAAINNACT